MAPDGERPARRCIRVLLSGVLVIVIGCSTESGADSVGQTTTTEHAAPSTARDTRGHLALLVVDDAPRPAGPYRRDDWPTWEDVDGDGCDAREQALIAQSTTPAQVDFPGCTVVAGDWVSPYDGVATDAPSDLDADHLVPLENAWESGAWRWDAGSRRVFANDQPALVMVTAHANRSKGSRTPDEWRPALESSWCTYATRWVALKHQWELSVTTRERDALGEMLDTCPG